MDSLGGTSACLMLACLSPALPNLEDSFSTLNYANRAKSIRNRPKVNMSDSDQVVHALRREVTYLRRENEYLQTRLAQHHIPIYGDDAPALGLGTEPRAMVGMPEPSQRGVGTGGSGFGTTVTSLGSRQGGRGLGSKAPLPPIGGAKGPEYEIQSYGGFDGGSSGESEGLYGEEGRCGSSREESRAGSMRRGDPGYGEQRWGCILSAAAAPW